MCAVCARPRPPSHTHGARAQELRVHREPTRFVLSQGKPLRAQQTRLNSNLGVHTESLPKFSKWCLNFCFN